MMAFARTAVVQGHRMVKNNKDALSLEGVRICKVIACDLGGANGSPVNTYTLASDMELVTGTDFYALNEASPPCAAMYRTK